MAEDLRETVRSFVWALRRPQTYDPGQNPHVLFGFLWGLPIPVVTLGLHLSLLGLPASAENLVACVRQQPLHLLFLLHPVFFAVIFGAAGTVAEAARRRTRELLTQLQEAADQDGLTGLLNYRAFRGRLDGEVERASREGGPICLVLIDVDRFKEINDRFGHPEGDRVLLSLAVRLRRWVRSYDVVARTGGDEFAVVLPNMGLEAAVAAAERMRADAEGGVRLSAGVAEHRGGETVADWIDRADRALYAAKASGRDRVCATPDSASRVDGSPVGFPPGTGG